MLFSYIALSGINLSEVSRALRTSDYLWLIPALIAFGLGDVARGLRWRSLFAPGRRPPRGSVVNATMIGYFYNSILPGARRRSGARAGAQSAQLDAGDRDHRDRRDRAAV